METGRRRARSGVDEPLKATGRVDDSQPRRATGEVEEFSTLLIDPSDDIEATQWPLAIFDRNATSSNGSR
jgi:hypothetical protein